MRFVSALLIVFALAGAGWGQCYIDQWGNMQCPAGPQYSGGYVGVGAGVNFGRYQSEHIVQESGWPDNRVVMLSDGGTAAWITICDQPYLISCKHKSARAHLQVGETLGFTCDDGSKSTATVIELGDGDCSVLKPQAGKLSPSVRPFRLDDAEPTPGETLYVTGFPMGRWRCRKAVVSRVGDDLQLRGVGTGGESGGPITNERGRLVGVLYGDQTDPYTGQSVGITLCCGHGMLQRLIARVEARCCPKRQPPPVVSPPPVKQPEPDPVLPSPQPPKADNTELKSILVQIENNLSTKIENISTCDCDNTAVLAELKAINVAISNIKVTPAPGGPAAPTTPQYYYQLGPRK